MAADQSPAVQETPPQAERIFVPAAGEGARPEHHVRRFLARFALTWLGSFILLLAVIAGVGLLLKHVCLPAGLGQENAAVSTWFVVQATPNLNTISGYASYLGATPVVLGCALLLGAVLLFTRWWRHLYYLFVSMTLSSATFLISTFIVGEPRPPVRHMDPAPPTASYPSGHTASAFTMFVGAAFIATTFVRNRSAKVVIMLAGIAIPVAVGIARMYRGMHFLTDVSASALLGTGAILLGILVTRHFVGAGLIPGKHNVLSADAPSSATIGVVANPNKTLGGGLKELRAELSRQGVKREQLLWREPDSAEAAQAAIDELVERRVDVLFAWGGDGTVRQCIEAVRGTEVALAILPAGTGNLLARNLGVPEDLVEAVAIGLGGRRVPIDVGTVNGEVFAVMAGAGFDAVTIDETDESLKNRLGRVAYIASSLRGVRQESVEMRVTIDGEPWFAGAASCVLVGNMGEVMGGLTAFPDASYEDGLLDAGVEEADGAVDWARTVTATLAGDPNASPLIDATRGRVIEAELAQELPYEVDGETRSATTHLRFEVQPRAAIVCAPREGAER